MSWDCSYLDTPEAPDFPATPNIGGAIDMLVGDVLPVEFKRTTSPHLRDKVHQMMRLGMFGAGGTKAGGPGGARVVMYVFAGSMEDKEIRSSSPSPFSIRRRRRRAATTSAGSGR